MLENIAQILKLKGSEVWCIAPDAKVCDALTMMAEKGVGSLVVVKEGQVIGILGERDFILKVDLCGRSSRTATVRQVMSEDVYCVTPGTSIDEAMAIVTDSRCRHLPVIENEQLVGLVSIGDLVKASLDEKDFVITQLKKYIKGEL
jgi:CBS domain-containing protein